jgi:iron complex outermembrane receptor protein
LENKINILNYETTITYFNLIFSVGLTAQEIKVSGVVNDNTKQPLPGTSILVKGTSKGTSADADGKYIISAAVGDILHLLLLDMKPKMLKLREAR